jgi:hypothetical protein
MLKNAKANIQNKFDQVIFGYVEGEFLPIKRDGRVANWDMFILYKLNKVLMPILQWVRLKVIIKT